MKTILNILTFTIITLTALILIFKPELVRTMIPGIVEKIYVTINKIIPREIARTDDLELFISVVAMIMPFFAGIMCFISDFDEGIGGKIMVALLKPLVVIVVIFVGSFTGIIDILIGIDTLYVIISYIFCCYIMTMDFKNCNCDCDCHRRESCDFMNDNCTTD